MKIISRKTAKARGLTRYFTGKPCKRGHVAERNVASRACMVCANEKVKAYAKTPEGRATKRAWRQSPKGVASNNNPASKARRNRYRASPLGQEADRRYRFSAKGKETGRRASHAHRARGGGKAYPKTIAGMVSSLNRSARHRAKPDFNERRRFRRLQQALNKSRADYNSERASRLLMKWNAEHSKK